jgi:hypothetical protein
MLTRNDCTRDNRKVYLPNASSIGYDQRWSKRGYWLTFDSPFGGTAYGRVVGRVRCQGVTYVEVIALFGCDMTPAVRWVLPDAISACRKHPPRNVLSFVLGEWTKPADIFAAVEYGISSSDQEG